MAFYPRSIQIDGILYKQITPNQWQNVNTGQIIDNTRMVVIINEFKKKQVTPVTPGGGASGACCEIPNMITGAFACTEKDEGSCPGGCFKVNQTCNITDESPEPCVDCVRCCYIADQYCVAKRPEQCVPVGNGGGTYFGSNGCTACKYGVCSSDQNNNTTNATERFYGSRGCTGTFIVGGGVSDFRTGVFCTGSDVGQTCFGPGMRYQDLTPVFIEGGTCADCILGACCTGGTCAGITSQSACANINGIFFAGQTCIQCNFGAFCTNTDGAGTTCAGIGYRGQSLTQYFKSGSTCASCIFGTCCTPQGDSFVTTSPVSAASCNGTFFPGNYEANVCQKGSCCVGATCSENIFRYDCAGVFNAGMTCIACSNGACCLPSGGCTLTSMGTCMATGGTFFGGGTCSACDIGVCCNNGVCTDQRRGNVCAGTFYAGANCSSTPCEQGVCCTGGNCISNTEAINCQNINGTFFSGVTCIACATGANCLTDFEINGDRTCIPNQFFGNVSDGSFYQNQGCSACQSGVCCNPLGGGTSGIRGDCTGSSTFYAGQTLFICDAGVFCTGSGVGQTCFGLGHRGQSLTNNFIAGATCSSCILGACCTGGTCLSGGLTSQAACNSAGGLFFAGSTCNACDYGVYCTGATCLSLGYRGQSLSNNFIVGATCSSCILGACCTGGTCSGGGQTSQAACSSVSGLFYPGATCRSCDYGVYCTGATCFELGYRAQALTNNFIQGATCNSCILGACCTGGTCLGGGQTSQAACNIAGGTFYAGATCFQCDTGVFCTGSGVGQTCFGLGHRGQSLTNNFIAGGTCSSCVLGACCTGGSCLGGGLTSQAACSAVGGLFYAGTTCVSCDYGVYCTGSNETTSCLGLGYRAQNLSNQFVISGSCAIDCVYGSCCQGTTCLGITKQGNCNKPNAFFAGMTCAACDTGTGACCTGGSSSITTITGCNALGGIFFPEGTTALCATGSCCTGGTCTQEILGRSGNCQVFVAGATCSICDTGVYCTGATCLQLGFRGQSLTSNFIVGATCSSCILGICCTGGTCIGGGQTAQINCPSSVGSFVIGATQCSACANNVNCCVGGTHSYILAETCAALGGIVFEGAEDPLVCNSGAFCTGRTCIGVTLYGFDLGLTFILDGDCGDCIYGTCCNEDNVGSDTTQNACIGTFTSGDYDPDICTAGLTYGVCCEGSTCSSDVLQSECSGFFVDESTALANNISCETNACQYGICCKENSITSVTGGVCLGEMTRAECAVTGGSFFASSEGYTCSNCLYIPMLASAVFERFSSDLNANNARQSRTFTGDVTGYTGNEIQPRNDAIGSADTWISNASSNSNYSGAGATTINILLYRRQPISGSQILAQTNRNFSPFRLWYDSGLTLHNPVGDNFGLTYGVYDAPPSGLTSANGYTLGYVLGNNFTQVYQVPRYIKITLGYGNPSDVWHGTELTYRWMGATGNGHWAMDDATKHAGLPIGTSRNLFPNPTPYSESTDVTPSVDFSSPVLVQVFAENPLKYRSRKVGSCCKGITCIGILTQDQCAFTGGTFNENAQCGRCYPDLVFGNCCVGGTHAGYTSLANCNKISGTFFEGTTFDSDTCIYGIICTEDRQCYQGISASYYGAFSSTNNKFFVQQNFGTTLGCAACDAGLCCVDDTCMGVKSKTECTSLGGTIYYDENVCETNCELGVCCQTGVTCGTYTNRADCVGVDKVFIAGAKPEATCSACESYLSLTSYSSGVTFTMILNKGTTYGTFQDGSYWVQEQSDLKLLDVRLQYPNAAGTTLFQYKASTKLSGLTLTPAGYKGSVYVHGVDKNPQPELYIHPTEGFTSGIKQAYTSINYNEYDQGWIGSKTNGATDNPASYEGFNLTRFLNFKNLLKYQGITLGAGDVVLTNATNFDPTRVVFPTSSGGYPYQVQLSRSNTLSYGVLNCLSATGAALAGATLCFRPPNSWPIEDKVNKPIYALSRLNGKIPGQTGNTLINVSTSSVDNNLKYSSVVNQAKTLTQVSEFANAVAYGTVTPMWAMHGPLVAASSYGEQYIVPLQQIIQVAYSKGSVGTSLTNDQRKDLIARIAQYGLDAWGAQKIYTTCLGSGAGQKAGRTRGWIPLAGYYLGETAMHDPEATMILDTQRLNKFIETYYGSFNTRTPGGTCATESQWRVFRYGDTGPANNYQGLRRSIARIMAHEVNTMIETVNDPSNLVRHYDYFGSIYKDTVFSGFGPTGATGITFYNEFRSNWTYDPYRRITVSGNFGVMRWGSTGASANPFYGRFVYSTKEGTEGAWAGGWMKVISGPGSLGGTGSRFYKVFYSTGFRTDNDPEINSLGGGYQIVLGQTWADGIPDHTSVLKFFPATSVDGGITRPSTFHPLGYTYSPVMFIINNNPDTACGNPTIRSDAVLFDGSLGSELPYFANSLDSWAPQYLLSDYIMKTKGVTLISDVAPIPDYIRQYVLTSPYNIRSLFPWYSGTSSVFNTWLGVGGTWSDRAFGASKINFAQHYRGIVNWRGITVG